MLPVKLHGVP